MIFDFHFLILALNQKLKNKNRIQHGVQVAKFSSHWKAIACDLDGTLIGLDHKVNERDMEALHQARRAGMHVAICTGRNALESAGVIGALGLRGPGVFVNGAMVCDMSVGKAMRSRWIADALAREVIDFLGSKGHAVMMQADDQATRLPAYLMTDHAPPHQSIQEWMLIHRISSRVCGGIPPEHEGRIVRLGIAVNLQEAAELEIAIARQFGERISTQSMRSRFFDVQILEVFSPGTNKWSGIESMATELKIDANQVIAVGDDTNDVAMLEGASLSFAMGNATPEIQATAKRVTRPQSECGVAAVIEDLLSGKLEPEAMTKLASSSQLQLRYHRKMI